MDKLRYQAGTAKWCCTAAAGPRGLMWGRKLPRADQRRYRRSPAGNPPQTGGPATRAPRRPYPVERKHMDVSRGETGLHLKTKTQKEPRTDLILHALLRRVHWVTLAALNALQRLLNLQREREIVHDNESLLDFLLWDNGPGNAIYNMTFWGISDPDLVL